MQQVIPAMLAWWIGIIAALAFCWDLWDLIATGGKNSVSEYIRDSWIAYPAGIAIGLLVASHFVRWPWR